MAHADRHEQYGSSDQPELPATFALKLLEKFAESAEAVQIVAIARPLAVATASQKRRNSRNPVVPLWCQRPTLVFSPCFAWVFAKTPAVRSNKARGVGEPEAAGNRSGRFIVACLQQRLACASQPDVAQCTQRGGIAKPPECLLQR